MEKIDLNKVVREKPTENDDNILGFCKYLVEEDIDLIRESYEVDKSDAEVNSEVLDILKELRAESNDKDLTELQKKYLNRAKWLCIANLKYSIPFFELMGESKYIAFEFLGTKHEELLSRYDGDEEKVFRIFELYITIKQYIYQNNMIREEYNEKMSLILYALIKQDIKIGKTLEEILEEKGIDQEYYDTLYSYYKEYEIDLDEDIEEIAKDLNEEYERFYETFEFTYIESSILSDYLELTDKKYTKKDFLKKYTEKFEGKFKGILRKISEFEY